MKRITVADIAPLIDAHKGNISSIGRALGVSRMTVQRRIDGNLALQEALEQAREGMIDNAESALYKQILDGNITAIIFFLKTRGKKRGYVERQEVTGADGGAIEHDVDYRGLTTEELTERARQLERQSREVVSAAERIAAGVVEAGGAS